jgi:hypothetical protein
MTAQHSARDAFKTEMRRALVADPSFRAASLVNKYTTQPNGPSRATAYTWAREITDTVRPKARVSDRRWAERARHLRERIAPGERRRAHVAQPPTVSMEEITGSTDVIGYLRECIGAAQAVIAASTDDSGKPLNIQALLAGSEHLRQTMETVVRVSEALRSIRRIDTFHRAVIECIAEESPECARRIVGKLQTLSNQWGM